MKRDRLRSRAGLQRDPATTVIEPRRFLSRESYALWLFEFLRVDLAQLSREQAEDWRHEAKQFVVLEGVILELPRGGGLQTGRDLPTISFLRAMQQELRDGLQTFQRGLDDWVRPPIVRRHARGGRILTESRQGSFRNLFVNNMLDLITENWSRIRACPQCGEAFLKVRKQQYCSPACSQKARTARFIAKGPRNYRREYERAVQKKLGTTAPLKNGRRQRSKIPARAQPS